LSKGNRFCSTTAPALFVVAPGCFPWDFLGESRAAEFPDFSGVTLDPSSEGHSAVLLETCLEFGIGLDPIWNLVRYGGFGFWNLSFS
jgi:hypothetical protein